MLKDHGMNRRELIKTHSGCNIPLRRLRSLQLCWNPRSREDLGVMDKSFPSLMKSEENHNKYQHEIKTPKTLSAEQLNKTRNFDHDFADDVYLTREKRQHLDSVLKKLLQVQNYVGFGYFNIISFKDILHHT